MFKNLKAIQSTDFNDDITNSSGKVEKIINSLLYDSLFYAKVENV